MHMQCCFLFMITATLHSRNRRRPEKWTTVGKKKKFFQRRENFGTSQFLKKELISTETLFRLRLIWAEGLLAVSSLWGRSKFQKASSTASSAWWEKKWLRADFTWFLSNIFFSPHLFKVWRSQEPSVGVELHLRGSLSSTKWSRPPFDFEEVSRMGMLSLDSAALFCLI